MLSCRVAGFKLLEDGIDHPSVWRTFTNGSLRARLALAMSKRRDLPRYEGCFVCGDPAVNRCSLELRVYWEDGEVKAVFVPGEEHLGYPGIVHGGILVSLLDEVSIWAASIAAQCFCVTRELRTKFLVPARPGESLSLVARVTERGQLLTVEATMENSRGEAIARSTGRFFPAFKEEWEQRVKRYLT
jgi:uncharacterized protein (TIGR00369 family)